MTRTSPRGLAVSSLAMPRSSRFRSAIIRFVACVWLAAPWLASAQDAATPPLFQRIVLLGASGTAGFEGSEPLGGPKTPQYRFAHYVEAALIAPHEPVATQANSLLFFQAEAVMERQVTATVAAKPTLVIGFDALFWFCYGPGMNAEERVARFEAGLRLLERIDAPLVVGDLPNAAKAVGGFLAKGDTPDPATLARCNERLTAWAASRRNVTVFPLARVMRAALANDEVVLAGHTWEKGKSGALLRSDHLHPSRHALAALAIATLESARATWPGNSPGELRRDVETVYSKGLARSAVAPKAQP